MNVHEEVVQIMRGMAEAFSQVGIVMQMPPSSNSTLGTRYVELDQGKVLGAEFRYDPRFANPIGTYQGGVLCALFDEVFGPLAYMVARRPAVTIEMSVSLLRSFAAKDEFLAVRAEVVARSRTLLVLKAEAKNGRKKLVATATSHLLVASDEVLRGAHMKTGSGALPTN